MRACNPSGWWRRWGELPSPRFARWLGRERTEASPCHLRRPLGLHALQGFACLADRSAILLSLLSSASPSSVRSRCHCLNYVLRISSGGADLLAFSGSACLGSILHLLAIIQPRHPDIVAPSYPFSYSRSKLHSSGLGRGSVFTCLREGPRRQRWTRPKMLEVERLARGSELWSLSHVSSISAAVVAVALPSVPVPFRF